MINVKTLSVTGGLVLAFAASVASAGVSNSKHNLGNANTFGNHLAAGTGTSEVCVFCHTPHGADSSQATTTGSTAPLWNRNLNPGNTYATYDQLGSATMDAKFANDGVASSSVGSVSLACLSCHDGSQAFGAIINEPNPAGTNWTPDVTNSANWVDGSGIWQFTGAETLFNIGGLNGSTGVVDLRNDHPIGMQYCGGGYTTAGAGATEGTAGGACGDQDFFAPSKDSANRWYVATNSSGSRDKNDLTLYSRNFTGGAGPSVECASCHDPHLSDSATFLRKVENAYNGLGANTTGGNNKSQICLSCHVK